MIRRSFLAAVAAALTLSGCAGTWKVAYDAGLSSETTRNWRVVNVVAVAPETLTVSNSNSFIPNADIVWWGEPYGDRRAQVAKILEEGITRGASELKGPRGVTITAELTHFHAVTPAAVAYAPGAVHNIGYTIQVFDSKSGEPLTPPEYIEADLEALVGAAAISAAIQGQDQRTRIVAHIAAVTRGWLGFGPDQRRTFQSIGR